MQQVEEPSTKLLEQIRGGVQIFEPRARSSRELLKFQELAASLLALEREGLIGKCIVEEAEIAGQQYINSVCVFQGLTPRGEQVLKELESEHTLAPMTAEGPPIDNTDEPACPAPR